KRPLVSALLASGVKLSDKSEVNLVIKTDRLAKIVQSVGVNNQVQEYRLEYDVKYTIGDSKLREVHIERDYSFDVQEIGGGQTEERTLRKQLAQDMARAIIRQLSATVK
ncbi:MAG: LPS assembly lipoprotein LptE, partial [Bacteroidales bacterium]|nr:LPS assembly lipoprotein LptE [Bacteroidales bacterium]